MYSLQRTNDTCYLGSAWEMGKGRAKRRSVFSSLAEFSGRTESVFSLTGNCNVCGLSRAACSAFWVSELSEFVHHNFWGTNCKSSFWEIRKYLYRLW
jgi:hypothetical protein